MAKKKKRTKVVKIKDPNTSTDSRYALKRNRAKRGVFSPNSPFNVEQQIVSQQLRPIEEMRQTQMVSPPNIIDRMIEKKRGISDEQLKRSKFKNS